MLELILFAVFPILLIAAAIWDGATMTIPNTLNIALALAFLPFAFAAGMDWHAIGMHALAGLIAFIVGAGLFYARVFGGGDAKLIASVMVWLGPTGAFSFIYYMALFGGVLALVILIARRVVTAPPSEPVWLARLLSKTEGVPYALAISPGALLALPTSSIFLQILPLIPSFH
jgi:prepilin peptidase CpaA